MRKIIASIHATLDGFISGPTDDIDNLDWVYPRVDETLPAVSDLLDRVDTMLLGRVTYEGFAQYWPTATGDFADQMNRTPKIVFSRTPRQVAWGVWDNIRLIHQYVPDEVRRLKQQPGKDMVIFASSGLVQSLTNHGLVDEYHIVIHPVILGSGKRLFEEIIDRHDLELLNSEAYAGGAVLLAYRIIKGNGWALVADTGFEPVSVP